MCQPFGTNVTAVCRLPHAKAITGQIMLYLENFNKAAKCVQNRGPVPGGVMPLRALAYLDVQVVIPEWLKELACTSQHHT